MNVWARGVFCRGESADRGHVHLCTKGHSGSHVGDQDLYCLEWRVVPRGENPSWVGFDGEGPTSSVRRGNARDGREDVPNEVTAVDGPRGSAFVSSDQPSGGRSRRVGRKSSGPPSRRNRSQASKRRRRGSHCEPDSTRSSGGRRRSDAPHCKEVHPEPEPKTIELPASRPTKKRLSIAPTSCLSGVRASERPRGTGVRPVGKAQDAYDSRGKDHAASDAPGGSQVQAKPKAQQENNEETENDVIFSELDGKWCEFGRGVRGSGSRAKQRRNGSIEAVPRGAPQLLSPDHESIGGGDGLIDGWPCGARGRHYGPEVQTQTGVVACSESGKRQTLNEEPPVARLRPPRRGWLRDPPAKGPLPQHGVYIGRSHGVYQPQGWENPIKPDPREGKQGLQQVLDAYEQHLCQSQILVDRVQELSGKVLYCHCKPADPCHADALIRAWGGQRQTEQLQQHGLMSSSSIHPQV